MSSYTGGQDSGGPEAQGKLKGETLSLSVPAAAHIRRYLLGQGRTDFTIRIAATRTHCMGGRGFSYIMDYDGVKPADIVIESGGVKLLVDLESLLHIKGAMIDYEEEFQGGGLVVRNPNAIGKCHCGRHDLFGNEERTESGTC